MKKIFYSSPYLGVNYDKITEEYNYVKNFIDENNMLLINYEGRDWRNLELNYADSKKIVNHNLYLLKRSDIFMVNLTTPNHKHIGCISDMIYAKMNNAYVITIVGNNEYDKNYYTIYHSDKIVKTIEEALEVAKNLAFQKNDALVSNNADIDRWNKIHREEIKGRDSIKYDKWLTPFSEIINNCDTPIIDLGCGGGNDALYLIEQYNKKRIYACDFSDEAIRKIRENLPEVSSLLLDMTEELPFKDNFTDIILADLSLHYFTEETTRKIIKEIQRVLKPNGHFLFRVNSVADINYGSMSGEKIEENFYKVRGTTKRFFNQNSILNFFEEWGITYINEDIMLKKDIRTCLKEGKSEKEEKEDKKDKILWTCAAEKKDSVR